MYADTSFQQMVPQHWTRQQLGRVSGILVHATNCSVHSVTAEQS